MSLTVNLSWNTTLLYHTCFFGTISSFDCSKVQRWTRKLNVFTKDKLFFPVNKRNNHWVLVVLCFSLKTITYYDSMSQDGMLYLQAVRCWVGDEAKDKKKNSDPPVYFHDWTLVNNPDNVPQQHNSSDCGVFCWE